MPNVGQKGQEFLKSIPIVGFLNLCLINQLINQSINDLI